MAGTFQSRMTSKGQVTVPAELRRELGLQPGDRVEFVRENGTIRVRKAESIVMKLAGSVKSQGRPLEPDEIHDFVAQGIADDYEQELKQYLAERRNAVS
jgi:antitoxin PrlF